MTLFGKVSVSSLALCVLLTISFHLGVAAQFAAKYYNANLDADVLILDYGTMVYRGNHPMGPAVSSPQECRNVCDRLPGCNAFTFCNSTSGCGSGCDAWAKKKPDFKYVQGGPIVDAEKTKLPILGFGPHSGGCSYETGKTDVWRYGVCSLKRVQNPAKPRFFASKPAEGWVSGVIARPSKCGGFSNKVCYGCTNSADSTKCFACASKGPQYTYSWENLPSEGCPTCYSKGMGAFTARCEKCLDRSQGCMECAFLKYPKQCLECYKNEAPQGGAPYCARCTDDNIGSEAAAIRCVHTCLPTVRPHRCKTLSQQNCIDDYSDVCPNCVKSSLYKDCISCSVKFPGNNKCSQCGALKKNTDQKRCMQCAMKSIVTGPWWCSDCLGADAVKNKEECLACVENPKTKADAKDRCSSCAFSFSTASKQKSCYTCLAKNPADPYACTGQ